MPVKLKSQSDPQDAMAISKAEYLQGRQNFIDHYYLKGCNTKFSGQDLEIPWIQLADAVAGYKASNPGVEVALRIVYCYDVNKGKLKLRIQLCQMTEAEDIENTYILIDDKCDWYKISNGQLVPCQDHNLVSKNYFENFYYCDTPPCDGTNAQLLADGVEDQLYARTITFPWSLEVEQLYIDNNSPQGAHICFGATSYVHANSGDANIAYPHGLVLYLKDADGYPLLNNDKDSVAIFHNKGADYGTLCPTKCKVYIVPQNITARLQAVQQQVQK